jgi:hypothetical protein
MMAISMLLIGSPNIWAVLFEKPAPWLAYTVISVGLAIGIFSIIRSFTVAPVLKIVSQEEFQRYEASKLSLRNMRISPTERVWLIGTCLLVALVLLLVGVSNYVS